MTNGDDRQPFQDDPEPFVGGTYMGMRIKKMKVTESTRVDSYGDTRHKKSFKMYLEGGIQMTEERYITKTESQSNDDGSKNKKKSGAGATEIKFPEMPNVTELEKELDREERRKAKRKKDEEKKRKKRDKEDRQRREAEEEDRLKRQAEAEAEAAAAAKADAEKERKRRQLHEEEDAAAAAATAAAAADAKNTAKEHKRVSFGPTTVSVLPEGDPDVPTTPTSDDPRIIWKFFDDDHKPADADYWQAQQVTLYPSNHGEGDTSYEPSISEDSISLSGVWGYAPGSVANDAHSLRDDLNAPFTELPDLPPSDVWVYPPGTQPPSHFPNHGTYTFAGKKGEWPPPVDDAKKALHNVGRLAIPDAFMKTAQPQSVTVYTKWKKPVGGDEDDDKDEYDYKTPIGEWMHPAGNETFNDDSLSTLGDWAPQDVLLYPPGQEPPASHEALPQGMWVAKQDLVLDGYDDDDDDDDENKDKDGDDTNANDRWAPPQVFVYPPGAHPKDDKDLKDDEIVASGTWSYPVGALKQDWPPPTEHEATKLRKNVGKLQIPPLFENNGGKPITVPVYSKFQVPTKQDDNSGGARTKPVGEWTTPHEEEDPDDDDWEPTDVVLFPPGEEPPSTLDDLPRGIWTIEENDEDNGNDEDNKNSPVVKVYPPGVEPDDGANILSRGKWQYPTVGALKNTWPPPTKEEARQLRRVGKLPQWNQNGNGSNWKPQSAHVFPKPKAPVKSTQSQPKGVWKYQAGKEPKGLNDWETQEVVIYPTGHELEHACDGKPHGSWGISMDAEPDKAGNWKPEDLWFYGPGDEPADDCAIQGKWAYPPGKLDHDWPPKSKGYVSPVRRVGKLKIPGMFDNGNGPPLALSPPKKAAAPRKMPATSGHSTSSSSRGSRDKPPMSPIRQESRKKDENWRDHNMALDLDESEQEEVEDPWTVPPKLPVRHESEDSDTLKPYNTGNGNGTDDSGRNSSEDVSGSGHSLSQSDDNDDDDDNSASRGPKAVMADYQSAFDYRPTSNNTKKKSSAYKRIKSRGGK